MSRNRIAIYNKIYILRLLTTKTVIECDRITLRDQYNIQDRPCIQ